MVKRVRWFAMGAAAGVGGWVYAGRKAREVRERFTPASLAADKADQLSGSMRDFGSTVREAVREGRDAMREREMELRSRLGLAPDAPEGAVEEQPAAEVVELGRRGRLSPRQAPGGRARRAGRAAR